MKKVNIGLSDKALKTSVDVLTRILADYHVLYMKTRNFHWNVVGARFKALHVLFEEQYDAIAETIDEVAERIRALGAIAPGTMKALLAKSELSEAAKIPNDTGMIKELLADHEQMIRSMRKGAEKVDNAGDCSTNDFIVGLIESHEKTAWMLRSYLEG